MKNYGVVLGVIFLLFFFSPVKSQSVMEYLGHKAHKITYETQSPATIEELKTQHDDLREKFLKIINLYPLPEKTPLNVKYVGDRVDLGSCYFQRVIFESRPKIYVAAHLYIPKNVSFPVPAVVHVPGHSRRDANRAHPRTYAENGIVSIALPMVGEEGKIGTGWGKCGEYGPYVGHFNWLNTGYNAIGSAVWDGVRAVDFLLSLTDSNGVKLVNKDKIGMAGLSGGAARTLWNTIADPRISCASVNLGVTTIDGYQEQGGISNTCDIHLFYNYYGVPYIELYSLIAPRPLLIQNGTDDTLFEHPEQIINALSNVYKLYGEPDRFAYKLWNQNHHYSKNIWNAENEWMDRWLRNGKSPIEINDELFNTELTCFPDGLPTDMQNTEELFTQSTPTYRIDNKGDYEKFRAELTMHLKKDVMRTAYDDIEVLREKKSLFKSNLYNIDEVNLLVDGGAIKHKGYFFYKSGEKRNTIILISSSELDSLELVNLYKNEYANKNLNLFCTEITGTGDNLWSDDSSYLYDRFAMLVGYTKTSLQVNDLIVAVKVLAKEKFVDPANIYIWGKGTLAVPAIYAAVADSNIAGVILENAQDRHIGITPVKESGCSTAMFNILKYADIPQVTALIYPRLVILAGEHKEGYKWTENVYETLNMQNRFEKTDAIVSHVLDIVKLDKKFK